MGRNFTELVKKQVANDSSNNALERIRAEAAAAREEAKQIDRVDREEHQKNIEETHEKVNECALTGRYKEAADSQKAASDAYNANPTEYQKNEMDRATKKLNEAHEELKDLKFSSIFEYFNSLYNNYNEYLDSLTPDKIVCVFNIIVGGLTFSSFFTILSIMLSENIINQIKIFDRFPIILRILRLRTYINKKIAKFYLFLHLVIIILGLLSNTYMLFL